MRRQYESSENAFSRLNSLRDNFGEDEFDPLSCRSFETNDIEKFHKMFGSKADDRAHQGLVPSG